MSYQPISMFKKISSEFILVKFWKRNLVQRKRIYIYIYI